ncbi:MAG TPA: ABC transporter permease [Acidimicrobiales bacterium]|jgi:ABC-2 type transport system permease protein/oleandomycin transport system permease protein|nr:ABC transporter permease [Acidimicrobiales bacterium]
MTDSTTATRAAVPTAELGAPEVEPGSAAMWAVRDGLTATRRNLIGFFRVPESTFFSTVQPIMFVLLFRYVFAVVGLGLPKGISYVNFLMPGIFVQTVAFGVVGTAIGLSEDLHKGLLERFRSLPMARSAVLVGRTTADLVRNVFVMVLMLVVGMAVGFRITGGVLPFLGGVVLILAFSYALFWGAAYLGLSAPNAETAQVMIFPILMPLTFASSCFVPINTMPSWLQVFARNQPVSQVATAARNLMTGYGPTMSPTLHAVAWVAGILIVLVPLAVNKYRRLA